MKILGILGLVVLCCCQRKAQTNSQEIDNSSNSKPQVLLENPNPNAQIKQKQLDKKNSVKLDHTLFQELSFIVKDRYLEFLVIPQLDEEIRVTLDVFWKQGNVYLLANVQKMEDIEVSITDGPRNVLYREVFYTTDGFKFTGVSRHTYRVRITNRGQIQKLVILRISEKIKAPQTAAKKTEMVQAQEKLFLSLTRLQTALADTKTGHILDEQIAGYVLHQSTAYAHFQIFESLLIVLISCVEVFFVTKLLKTDIVV